MLDTTRRHRSERALLLVTMAASFFAPRDSAATPQPTPGPPPKRPPAQELRFAETPAAISWAPLDDPVLALPTFVAPEIDRSMVYLNRAERSGFARPSFEATAIRRGLAASSMGPPAAIERAVGLRFGPERFSLATSVISGTGSWQSADTRFDWTLARRSMDDPAGLRWGIATGGEIGVSGGASQNASATFGYRHRLLDNVTLTSEIALASTFAFAAQNRPEATITPQVQVLADLTGPVAGPWRTVLDVKLRRQVPVSGSEFQTNGSAMLRLKYQLK